jgi:ribosomal protein S18 acetylase RimI-like enzyme
MAATDVLERIDAYLDAVPRTAATAERIGPFTLFVQRDPAGWPFYARPTRDTSQVRPEDVFAVRERQRALGVPEELEWVVDLAPVAAAAARATGLEVVHHPLLHLEAGSLAMVATPDDVSLRTISSRDDVARTIAVAHVAFANPGADRGPVGPEAAGRAAGEMPEERVAYTRERISRGLTVTIVAERDGAIVAVGSHQPLEGATELVGIATLPAERRRGLGAAITAALARDALDRGLRTVFLSAGDDITARVYERVGFRVVGSVGAAAPA